MGLNQACGLPSAPTCTVVDLEDPNGEETDDSGNSTVRQANVTVAHSQGG